MNRADRALIIIIGLFCGGGPRHSPTKVKYFTRLITHTLGGCGQIVKYYLNAYLAYPYFIPTRDTCTVQGCTTTLYGFRPRIHGRGGSARQFFLFINDELSHITPRRSRVVVLSEGFVSWQRKSVSSVFPPEYSKYTIKAVNSITKLSTTTSSTARHFIFVCLAVCDNPCYSHTVSCTSLAGAVLPIYIYVLYTYSVRPARNPMHHAPTPRKAPLACAQGKSGTDASSQIIGSQRARGQLRTAPRTPPPPPSHPAPGSESSR